VRRSTFRYLVLGLVLLLALGLRLYRLDAQSFWYDEGNTARVVERSVPLILKAAEGDIHPPGYYLLLHYWRALAGDSEYALRLVSAFCGVLTAALTYSLGRRMLGWAAGLGGAFLAAVSPLSVYYSQEARMYMLLGLLATASTYFLLRLSAFRPFSLQIPARLPVLAYVLAAAAGLYTQYTFPFILLVHNALFLGWWLVRGSRTPGRWRFLLGWAIIQIAAVLLFLPWLPIALEAVTTWSPLERSYSLGRALGDVFRTLVVGVTSDGREAARPLASAAALLAAGLWPRRRGLGALGALVAWLLLPVAFVFGFGLYRPAYLKVLLIILPPLHLLLASGVENLATLARNLTRTSLRRSGFTSHLSRFVVYTLLLVVPLLPSLRNLYFDPAYRRDDYRQIAADIRALARPAEDGIILNAANQWEVFTYYFGEEAWIYPLPRSRPARADTLAAELEQIAADHRRLFVVYWGDAEADPEKLVERWLADHAYWAGDRWYGRVRLAVYGLGLLPGEPSVALRARFGEAVLLRGYAAGEGLFAPGDVIPVTLFWQAEGPVEERYKVFLHLLDQGGGLIAQTDGEPGGNLIPTTIWSPGEVLADRYGLLIPQDLPAGEYTLVAGLYRRGSGERLPVVLDDQSPADRLILGSVKVLP
jgi:mannosyltransferase